MKKNFFITNVKTLLIIAPEKLFLKKINDALNLIERIDPDEYKNLFSRISLIFVTYMSGGMNTIFAVPKIWFVNKSLIKESSLNWLASQIIHEGIHATQIKDGKWILPSSESREKAASKFQAEFLRKLGDQEGVEHVWRVFKEKYWIEMKKNVICYAYYENLLDFLVEKKLKLTYVDLASLDNGGGN